MKKENNDIEKKIIEVLDRIRPYLENDGGNLEYIKFEEGIVYIKLLGACAGCSMIDITLKDGIEAMLMDPTTSEDIINILEMKDRTKAGICAPACGLYLKDVYY